MIAPIMRDSDPNMLSFAPCGGTTQNAVHFEANSGSKNMIGWTVLERSEQGNCTMKVGSDPDGVAMEILFPLD